MNLNQWLRETRKPWTTPSGFTGINIRPKIECADGLILSVQASHGHYCTPREDEGPYTAVEVGYPSEAIPEFMEYCESPERPTDTVYGWVPFEVVEAVIEKHGGAK
ncbi:MAG: hypothetical protein WC455_18815 [Dehalococcoidia bacterium]|jgi:hypothetical protein